MPDIPQEFAGLPIGQLICGPIIEVAKGQSELCKVYLDFVSKLAWKDGKQDGETNIVKFNLTRPVTDGAGNISTQSVEVQAPLISLVPVPAFTMDQVTVNFTMEVKDQTVDKKSLDETASFSAGVRYWGWNASLSGSVTNKSENTRSTDHSAKYDIFAKAIQQPPAEGMAKLSTVFAACIEPIAAGGGK
jgi:hypothetical protein